MGLAHGPNTALINRIRGLLSELGYPDRSYPKSDGQRAECGNCGGLSEYLRQTTIR
jgi:hypothetical protein